MFCSWCFYQTYLHIFIYPLSSHSFTPIITFSHDGRKTNKWKNKEGTEDLQLQLALIRPLIQGQSNVPPDPASCLENGWLKHMSNVLASAFQHILAPPKPLAQVKIVTPRFHTVLFYVCIFCEIYKVLQCKKKPLFLDDLWLRKFDYLVVYPSQIVWTLCLDSILHS